VAAADEAACDMELDGPWPRAVREVRGARAVRPVRGVCVGSPGLKLRGEPNGGMV